MQLSNEWDADEKGFRIYPSEDGFEINEIAGYNTEAAKMYWSHTTYDNIEATNLENLNKRLNNKSKIALEKKRNIYYDSSVKITKDIMRG